MKRNFRLIAQKSLLLSILIILFSASKSQSLQVILDPIIQNSNNSVFNLSLINNSSYSGTANLVATLRTRKGNTLLKQEVSIEIASKEVKRVNSNSVNTVFIDENFSKLYQEGQMLPPYDYVLCVTGRLIGDIGSETEECIDFFASDFIALIPAYPPDEETISQSQPVFSWLNNAVGYKYTYNFKLVHKEESQNSNAAIRRNQPIIQLNDISENTLFFPSDAAGLINGEEYVWQLGVVLNGEEVTKSDAFSFSYKEGNEYIDIPRDLSYVNIREIPSGAELYAVGVFKFRFDSKSSGKFTVKLFDEKREKYIDLEESELIYETGFNKYDYDLKEQVYLRHLKNYKLELTNASTKEVYQFSLKFVNPDFLD